MNLEKANQWLVIDAASNSKSDEVLAQHQGEKHGAVR